MIDAYDFALQVVVPWATAATFYALMRRSRDGVVAAGCLSSVLATFIIMALAVWIHGVTSTLSLGLVITFGLALAVSGAVVAALYGVDRLRSK